jgi:hypothetical protein
VPPGLYLVKSHVAWPPWVSSQSSRNGPMADAGRQQDKRLEDYMVGLMTSASKKPGSRLQRKMGGPAE